MPLPKPNEGESRDDFMTRCMGNPTMNEEYPDNEQRAAVCNSQWRKAQDDDKGPRYAVCKSAVDDIRPGERAVIFRVSDATPDRDKEVLLPSGADLTEFRKNPIVDWDHQRDPNRGALPVAKASKPGWIKYDKSAVAIMSKAIFAEDDFADRIFKMYQDGFLKAASIQADSQSIKMRDPTDRELKDHPEWEGHNVWDKWTLLAYSAVAIPANPSALAIAASKGYLDGGVDVAFGVKAEDYKKPPRRRALVAIKAPQPRRRVILPGLALPGRKTVVDFVRREFDRLRGRV